MKLGLIITSTDPEVVWNAFRLGVLSLGRGDSATAFLLASGVEVESIDTGKFNVTEQVRAFAAAGGKILACGTCLKIRGSDGTELCPMSTMADLYELVKTSDRVLTF
jgi:uncharacterized protein involved in oxidation of intracellular sulfur